MRKACLCLVVACGGLAGCAVPLDELDPLDRRARGGQVHARGATRTTRTPCLAVSTMAIGS
ncbi:MAG: hypothetical protein R3E85_15365 [Planctomycetota bacterium]